MMKRQTILFILAFMILAVQGPNYPNLDQMTAIAEHDFPSRIDILHSSCMTFDNSDDDEDDGDLDLFEIVKYKQRRL
jgi:hypothetical protein